MKPPASVRDDIYQSLIRNVFDGIYQIDKIGRVIAWNQGAERITGIQAEQVLGTFCGDNHVTHLLENGTELESQNLPILLTLNDGNSRESLVFFKHTEGYRVSTLARTIPTKDELGQITGAMEIFSDNKAVIAAYQRNRKVEQTMLLDALTGIGNRPHIEGKIKFAIEDYQAIGAVFGVLFIDIDHFKNLNDTYGHLTGDKVLRFVANTLRQNLRTTDSCGRWGGEEFLALVPEINAAGLRVVAEKLRGLIEQANIEDNGKILKVTISIGATMIRSEDDFQSLLRRADELMYQSKQGGRNRATTDE
jgi:diguanylate cyclase (GGDEF)-like protein/PAS domain S-box-containing protein